MPTPEEKIQKLLDAIVANQAKLAQCKQHTFGVYTDDLKTKFKKISKVRMTCSTCEGEMTLPNIEIYMHGFKAAGGDPELVLKDYMGLHRRKTKE